MGTGNIITESTLAAQRIDAAGILKQIFGQYYASGTDIFQIMAYDPNTDPNKGTANAGMVQLVDLKTGAISTVDPLSILYPNAVPAPTPTPPGGGSGTSPFTNLMSLGQTGVGIWSNFNQQTIAKNAAGKGGGVSYNVVKNGASGYGQGTGGPLTVGSVQLPPGSPGTGPNIYIPPPNASGAATNTGMGNNVSAVQTSLSNGNLVKISSDGTLYIQQDPSPSANLSASPIIWKSAGQYGTVTLDSQTPFGTAGQQTNAINLTTPDGNQTQVVFDPRLSTNDIMSNTSIYADQTSSGTLYYLQVGQQKIALDPNTTNFVTGNAEGHLDITNAVGGPALPFEGNSIDVSTLPVSSPYINNLLDIPSVPLTSATGDIFQQLTHPEQYLDPASSLTQTNLTGDTNSPLWDFAQNAGIQPSLIPTYIRNQELTVLQQPIPMSVWNAAGDNLNQSVADWYNNGSVGPMPTQESIAAQMQLDSFKSSAQNYETSVYNQQIAAQNQQANAAIRSGEIKFGVEAAATAASAYEFQNSITDMVIAGKASFANIAKAVGSLGGMAVSLTLMHNMLTNTQGLLEKLEGFLNAGPNSFLNSLGLGQVGTHLGQAMQWLSSGPGIGLLMGATFLYGLLNGLFNQGPDSNTTAAETLNAETLPLVSNPGGVITAAGLAFALMGLNTAPSISGSYSIDNLSATTVNALLQKANGGSGVGTVTRPSLYGDLFVDQSNGQTNLIYVQPTVGSYDAQGNSKESIKMFTMPGTNLNITAPGSAPYIPMLITDSNGNVSANPQAVDALNCQQKLLMCQQTATSSDLAQNCTLKAATCDKTGTWPE